ncbi:MAG: TRAP transporter fused permease subunit [Tissierellia bacterium]|nr:TRAP transporter fused permease subunit [Tissierellia bacterium]
MILNRMRKRFFNPASVWALMWTLFQIWIVIRGAYPSMVLRPIHVCFAMGLVFLTKPMLQKDAVPKGEQYWPKWYDYIFVLAVIACLIHFVANGDRMMSRMVFVDKLTTMDHIVGVVMLILLLECSRRGVNTAFTIIVAVFMAYAVWGGNLPGIFQHSGQSLSILLENQLFSTTGVFSSPASVSASMVFYFLLFGAFLTATPSGQLFINISRVLTRKLVGGAGKASIVAAALFGMISGSAPANVTSIGTIMYPSMKEENFGPMFSGSIFAIEGTAGQLIPPVMGAAAFIMVDMTGHSYAEIMKAAILPSVVFLSGLYFLVHLYAVKNDLRPVEEDVTHMKKDIFRHIHLLLGVLLLIVLIIKGYSMMRAATVASLSLVLLCFLRKDTRLSLYEIIEALETTAKQATTVAIPCALAGIIIGSIASTGLGFRFSSIINALAQNSLLLALVATMLMALVLGMGMPTSAAYIMSSALLCPTIVDLGIPVLVAHFFVFYFANLSALTPPVALASYAAGGIVEEDMWKLGLEAFKYSIVIFMIPYIFIYHPALLGLGTPLEIAAVVAITLINTFLISAVLIGYGLVPVTKLERVLMIIASVGIIVPETTTTIAGLVLFAAVMLKQYIRRKRFAEGSA